MLNKLKTINSHAGLARFLGECSADPIGYVPRQPDIPSPYSYSAAWSVWEWAGKAIIWSEVKHKTYCVYEVPRLAVRKRERDCWDASYCQTCDYTVPNVATHMHLITDSVDMWRA
jgi:hypothetical protein